jgi:hypothetical protein
MCYGLFPLFGALRFNRITCVCLRFEGIRKREQAISHHLAQFEEAIASKHTAQTERRMGVENFQLPTIRWKKWGRKQLRKQLTNLGETRKLGW